MDGIVPGQDSGVFLSVNGSFDIAFDMLASGTQGERQTFLPPSPEPGIFDLLVLSADAGRELGRLHDAIEYRPSGPPQLVVTAAPFRGALDQPVHAEVARACSRGSELELRNEGDQTAHQLALDLSGSDFSVAHNDCPGQLQWNQSCRVQVCLDRTAPGAARALLRVASLEGATAQLSLSGTVLPFVEGLDPRFPMSEHPRVYDLRTRPSDDGLIFSGNDAWALGADGALMNLGALAARASDAAPDGDGGFVVLAGNELIALDGEGQRHPSFGAQSSFNLQASGQALWLTNRGRALVLDITLVRAFELATGAAVPIFTSPVVLPNNGILRGGVVTTDDRLVLTFWVTPGREVVILGASGQVLDTFSLLANGGLALAPDGDLWMMRGAQLVARRAGLEQVVAYAQPTAGAWIAMAFDGRGRLLASDGSSVQRWSVAGALERTWSLTAVGQLWCPRFGGCFAENELLWRLSGD